MLAFAGLVASGCGSIGGSGADGGTGGHAGQSGGLCVPGASAACACTDGQTGAQVCNATGTGFDACVCSGAGGAGGGAAGSSQIGSGGAAGASTTGAGGATGAGGTTGSGGTTGAGGTTGSGGTTGTGGTTGSGGTTGTGGTTGSGGATGSGGTTGSGGATGAGGTTGGGGLGPPANNQIVNGDFNNGSSDPWHVTNGGAGVTSGVTNGQYCVTVPSSTLFTIGWPAGSSPVAVLQPSTTYELYYQMSTTATFYTFQAKVGSATSASQTDFTTSGTQGAPTAGAGLQTFAFTFVPGSDPGAGVAFNIEAGYNAGNPTTVCIDNVYLGTPN